MAARCVAGAAIRMYVPSERISVVVMFNHLSDARAAAVDLLAAVLLSEARRPKPTSNVPMPDWLGAYIEPETRLAVRIGTAPDGQVRLRYGHSAELLDMQADGTAGNGSTRLRPGDGGLWMDRPYENQSSCLLPCSGASAPNFAGRYRNAELDAVLTVADAGGVLYGGFSGFLGQGRMEMLDPVAPDLWTLPCPRALDHTPPGDWTLAVERDQTGQVTGMEVGCWLARRLPYAPIG